MKLTIERIRRESGSDIFRRGEKYYKNKRVTLINIELDKIEAEVEGTTMSYHVNIQEIGENLYSSCTCPYWTTCKHVVATLLEAKDWYEENADDLLSSRTRPPWKKFFEKMLGTDSSFKGPIQQWRVIFLIDLNAESWSLMPQKAYIKKNGFLGRFSNIGDFDLTSNELIYSPNDPIVVSHIQKIEQQNNSFYNNRYFGRSSFNSLQAYHYRYGSRLGPLFDLLHNSIVYKSPFEDQLAPVKFARETAQIHFSFKRDNGAYHLIPAITFKGNKELLDASYKVLTENPVWLLKDLTLIKIANLDHANLLVPFTKTNITLSIPEDEFPAFLESVYPRLRKYASIPLPDSLNISLLDQVTRKKIVLRENERHLEISLKFDYGRYEIDYNDSQESCFKKDGHSVVQIVRDQAFEDKAWNTLVSTGLKDDPKGGLHIVDSKALKWLFKNLPTLSADGFCIVGRESLQRYKVRTGEPKVRIGVSSQIDWFDLNVQIDIDGVALNLRELRKAIRGNSHYVKLADKSIAQLSDEWFARFQHLFNFTEAEETTIKVSPYHATLIDKLFEQADQFEADEKFRASVARLSSFDGIRKKSLPKKLKGELRPYQKAGYNWLYFLQEYGFGGCLADDMGLGKTVQTLAVLMNDKQHGNKRPSLIVCPTSVVYNWEKEVQKFTPDLTVLIHAGLQRDHDTAHFDDYDIILTSYGIMRRDAHFLKDYVFHYVILDESQKIKNPLSQTSKAARLLRSDQKLVLTGTPVENNTQELWAQFAFLNPGLLSSLYTYKRMFANPIEKRKDAGAAAFLRDMIFPFILRRTKEGVARELPPKVEQTYYCAMSPAQERLYIYWRDFYRAKILDKIDAVGLNKARINVLEGLVKLRQISCHPYLVDKSMFEDSGKFESLKEFIEEILAENHKVLVFSQFVKMLRLIRHYLDERTITYEYLDGHTTHRMNHVDRFQNDPEIRIFLISLKAGGVGLNLTAADYVIHYDPWWNPAVEVQATDRAHRIGQDKKVFVYRLITKDSVEEKMLELQTRKKKLVSDLITTDSSFFKSLTRDDIEILFG
ncbi:serine/threonine protein kinase [candidate division KSB1 bacterium]|nr:SNF2 helicase associated domain-containing protein [candidate division KSB1 bacterium]RQW05030.1 MAG: serine/threonine protein kinase [candidate division KSB1 bacterium]